MADTLVRTRDPRLDVLRGLALVMIFINHVPGNPLEHVTSRNFGFSDAAEGFVFMAGISAGLAYGRDFRSGAGRGLEGSLRIGARVWTLYLVHLLIMVMALGIAAGATLWFDAPGMLQRNGINMLFERPLQALAGLPVLTWQLGYADILPLYIVLLSAAPVLIWLAWRWPRWLVAGSVLLWAVAAEFRLNLPNAFGTGGWFLNPFSWQVLFVLGLLTGLAMRDGRRLVPVHRGLTALAVGILCVALVWVTVPAVGGAMNTLLWRATEAGVPHWLTSFNKNYVHFPRLVHFLALAYVLASVGWVRQVCLLRGAQPLAMLGRQSLPVFALGSVLAYVLQAVKTETGLNPPLDLAMVLGGLAVLFGFAALRRRLGAAG